MALSIHTSFDDLKSSIKSAESTGKPHKVEELNSALVDEMLGQKRTSVMQLLQAAIKRQKKQKRQ